VHEALASRLSDALVLAVWIGLPALGAGFLVALLVSALQALTQWTEPSLNAIPRSLAVLLSLALAGSWMSGQLTGFAAELLRALPELVR
jgi:flagellar biosynthesis protein FliQ